MKMRIFEEQNTHCNDSRRLTAFLHHIDIFSGSCEEADFVLEAFRMADYLRISVDIA